MALLDLSLPDSIAVADALTPELDTFFPQVEVAAAVAEALALELAYAVELEDAAVAVDAIEALTSQTVNEIHAQPSDAIAVTDTLEPLLFDGNIHLVTSVTPPRGLPGDTITIRGQGFAASNNNVRLDGTNCTIVTQSTTEIVITQPTTFGVTEGFAELQVNNFDNNRVTTVPFWIKRTTAVLETARLPDQRPGVEEFSSSTPAAGGDGTIAANPLRAEARMWERMATMVDFLLRDTLVANGDIFVRDATGLTLLDGDATGEEKGQRLVADSAQAEGVRWGYVADLDFPFGGFIGSLTTTAVLLAANGVNPTAPGPGWNEWVAPQAGTIDAAYAYQQSQLINTDRLDRVRILVNGTSQYDSGTGLAVAHRGRHFVGNLSIAVSAGDRIQLEVTKTGTANTMSILGAVRMMTT